MTAVQLQQLKDAFNADYDQQAVTKVLDMAFGSTEQDTQPSMVTIDYATDPMYGFPTQAKAANITHIKHIRFYDNQNIYVFDITLDATCTISRARENIKKLVTKLIAPYSNAILLFHYADAANKEWRISWVTKGSGNTHTGAAKRYTFLCGKMHPARTIVDRLSKISESKLSSLPDKITEVFSVEALSDEFFAEYKAFYEDIVQYICGARYVEVKQNKYERKEIEDAQTIAKRGIFAKFVEQAIKENSELSKPIDATKTPEEQKKAKETQEKKQIEDAEKLVRNYVKKLLGRLVFIQFLAKKGWMGLKPTDAWGAGNEHFLHNIYDDYHKNSGNDNFVGDVLNKVLFYSLNITTGMDGNVAICSNNIAGTNYKFPYLNGGLFEVTELDGLGITIPGYFFVSDNREYADDDAKAPKNTTRKFIETAKKKSKKKNGEESANVEEYPYSASEGLFEFFERYNFTIDENGSDEAVVGIDPEMLGKIFENLLEDNKDKGAFYTPKPVVEYMCQQSLIAYLQNGVLKGVQNGSLQNGVQNLSVGSTALQNGVLNGVQSGAKNTLQNGAQQTTLQNSNEISTTNTSSDELQKANLAFIRDSLTEGEIKAQIEHFVKTKSLDIETSVETRQGLGEVGIESGSESATKKDNERAESAPKKDNEGADAGSKIESAESGSENGSAEPTTKEKPKPQMSIEMVSLLNHLLKEVKICDPAIGSGAFPMGLLNELLECREVLALRLIDEGRKDEVFADK